MTEKTGLLASVAAVSEDDDILLITDEGTMIRTSVASIPVHSRATGGVIVMRLSDGAKIVTFARVEKEEEISVEETEVGEVALSTETVTEDIAPTSETEVSTTDEE